jgi:hypothetical protein
MFLLTRSHSDDSSFSDDMADGADESAISQRGRRGTTAMEYLMMISLIVVIALTGIGYFGGMTNNVASNASNAITKSIKKGG